MPQRKQNLMQSHLLICYTIRSHLLLLGMPLKTTSGLYFCHITASFLEQRKSFNNLPSAKGLSTCYVKSANWCVKVVAYLALTEIVCQSIVLKKKKPKSFPFWFWVLNKSRWLFQMVPEKCTDRQNSVWFRALLYVQVKDTFN